MEHLLYTNLTARRHHQIGAAFNWGNDIILIPFPFITFFKGGGEGGGRAGEGKRESYTNC